MREARQRAPPWMKAEREVKSVTENRKEGHNKPGNSNRAYMQGSTN